MNTQASMMAAVGGERVALQDVMIDAVLLDLFAEVTVTQAYRNDEPRNIEAVYTFPLPLDATLLDFTVTIGERRLAGTVVEKQAAEAAYEDAINAGDSAVMLEAIEPGLYTMNVSNLLAHETATVTFRYAMLHRWSGDRLRFHLPTTIAPRYGASPHRPHQAPEGSLAVENRFSLRLEVRGALRDAQFDCPSHAVELSRTGDATVLSLQQDKAVMDRDFIVNMRAPSAARSVAVCGHDGDGFAAVASFQPFFAGLRRTAPLKIAIVVDCSGSMNGDSIAQAKKALDGMLERLRPDDRLTIVAFGSSTSALFERTVACTPGNLGKARRFARTLDATMGGTDIGAALEHACRALADDAPGDIFLVTDGQASAWDAVITSMAKAGHRVFTVGVGSAVSEAFLQRLASVTGGHCELVSPREGMAQRVVRHFERIRAPRAKRVTVRWPDGATNVHPLHIASVFEGDTVVASATLARAAIGAEVMLEVEMDDGEVTRQTVALAAREVHKASDTRPSTVARVAAAHRLGALDADAGTSTALRYQLTSPWTNWLVIAERAEGEKSEELPALRKVPQTMAAGWHGTGTVMSTSTRQSLAMVECRSMCIADFAFEPVSPGNREPAALRLAHAARASTPLPAAYERLLEMIEDDPSCLDEGNLTRLLRDSGLRTELVELMELAAELGIDDASIAAIVIARFAECDDGDLSAAAEAALAALEVRAAEGLRSLCELRDHAKSLRAAMRRLQRDGILRRLRELDAAIPDARLARLIQMLEGVGRAAVFAHAPSPAEASLEEALRF